MARPKAVRQQAEEAERKAREIAAAMSSSDSPSIEDLIQSDSGEPDASGDGQGPTPPDTDHNAAPDTHQQQRVNGSDNAQEELRRANERYHTLQSKYDAEVPRLMRENGQLKDELNAARGEVDSLRKQLEEAMKAPAVSQEEVQQVMRDLEDEFSSDAVKAFANLTEKIVASKIPSVSAAAPDRESEIQELRQEVARMRTSSAEATLEQLLKDEPVHWRKLNEDPEFIRWLADTTDWRSGASYQQLMEKAWSVDGDIGRVAQFFKEYARHQQSLRQQEAGPRNGSDDVQPGSSGADTPSIDAGATGNKKIWKLSEINTIDRRARAGEFRGKEAELSKLRRMIEQAAAEGRVDQTA